MSEPLAVRILPIGPRSYIREVVTPDEEVVESRPLSRAQAERDGALITPPDGYREYEQALTTRRALLRRLTAQPNTRITNADVCGEMGRVVSRQAVRNATMSLRRDMPIEALGGGGYVFLLPVPATGEDCCDSCAAHARLGCKRLKGRPVPLNFWCGGFRSS